MAQILNPFITVGYVSPEYFCDRKAAIKGLLEKDFVSEEQGVYYVYDKFFVIWLKENY